MTHHQSRVLWIAAAAVAVTLSIAAVTRTVGIARTRFFVVVNTMFAAANAAPAIAPAHLASVGE
jgi:hypothetical protein